MTRLFTPLKWASIIIVAAVAGCKGATAPDFSGQWAEKSAERIVAVFAPAADGGYDVQAGWREEGLAQYEAWSMTAVPGKAGALSYSDGSLVRMTFESQDDTEYSEETVYSGGTGSFRIDREGNLVWTDGSDGSETIFVRTDLNGNDSTLIAPELIPRVLEVCEYIPDHLLLPDASEYMTEDFYKALSEAFDRPSVSEDGTIDEYEWLYTLVTGNGGALPVYSVESVHRTDRTHASAVVGVRDLWAPADGPSGELRLHHMDLVLQNGHWLISDFDHIAFNLR